MVNNCKISNYWQFFCKYFTVTLQDNFLQCWS